MGPAWVPKVPGGSPFSQLNESEADVYELAKTSKVQRPKRLKQQRTKENKLYSSAVKQHPKKLTQKQNTKKNNKTKHRDTLTAKIHSNTPGETP